MQPMPILEFIPRSHARKSLRHIPPEGYDIWTAYEFSWLNNRGSPEEAVLRLKYSAASNCIVESKSLKLFLGEFATTRYASKDEVREKIISPLCKGLGVPTLHLDFLSLEDEKLVPSPPMGYCLDIHDLRNPTFEVDAALLRKSEEIRDELMYTHSFRSLCPVTGQPDWATVFVLYRGPEILPDSLRSYLCSYRNHRGFHESCCELIFSDITSQCAPLELSVACCFTRRGGIDITPLRSSSSDIAVKIRRTFRQ